MKKIAIVLISMLPLFAVAQDILTSSIVVDHHAPDTFIATASLYVDQSLGMSHPTVNMQWPLAGISVNAPLVSQTQIAGSIYRYDYVDIQIGGLNDAMLSENFLIAGIQNIPNSATQPSICNYSWHFDSLFTLSSPRMVAPAVVWVNGTGTLVHDPGWYDPDNDLVYYNAEPLINGTDIGMLVDYTTGIMTWPIPTTPGLYMAQVRLDVFPNGGGIDHVFQQILFVVNLPLGEEEVEEEQQVLQVYPNPANDATTIALTLKQPQPLTLTVHDALGKEVYKEMMNGTTGLNQWPLMLHLTPGVYAINVTANDWKWVQQLVVK